MVDVMLVIMTGERKAKVCSRSCSTINKDESAVRTQPYGFSPGFAVLREQLPDDKIAPSTFKWSRQQQDSQTLKVIHRLSIQIAREKFCFLGW